MIPFLTRKRNRIMRFKMIFIRRITTEILDERDEPRVEWEHALKTKEEATKAKASFERYEALEGWERMTSGKLFTWFLISRRLDRFFKDNFSLGKEYSSR